MNYKELIERRKSCRRFQEKTLSEQSIREIQSFFDSLTCFQPEIKLSLQIHTGDAGKRLEGVAGYKGFAFMAPAYLVLLSDSGEPYENAGYIAEALTLKLTDMGIDQCWLTIDDGEAVKKVLSIQSEQKLLTVVAAGYAAASADTDRIDIITPSDVRFKDRKGHYAPKIDEEEMVFESEWGRHFDFDNEQIDPILDEALYAASLAPSFLNRQSYRYMLTGRYLVLFDKRETMVTDEDTRLDMGATMFNFHVVYEAGVPNASGWTLGVPEGVELPGVPEEYAPAAYYRLF